MDKQNDLMKPDAAAKYLGVSRQTLAKWRCTGRYEISYVKVGNGRLVYYRKSDLDAFIDKHTVPGASKTKAIAW